MREGYPLEREDGSVAQNQPPFGVPGEKVFKLPHGRGEVSIPKDRVETRELALELTNPSGGYPYEPTGDPLKDGVGPAAWAERQDWPELDGHGHAKIVPMASVAGYSHAAGRDPRGKPVWGKDRKSAGTITDMWIDKPELLVRYLEMELEGGGKRLIPMTMARIFRGGVWVDSLKAEHFAGVPTTKATNQVTLLEEEKICAYYCGGTMYS